MDKAAGREREYAAGGGWDEEKVSVVADGSRSAARRPAGRPGRCADAGATEGADAPAGVPQIMTMEGRYVRIAYKDIKKQMDDAFKRES